MGRPRAYLQAGYTLFEGLLVLAILGIIAATSAPIYLSFRTRNDLDLAVSHIHATVLSAERLSQAVAGDSVWSIHVVNGSTAVYPGTIYAPAAAGLSYVLPPTITVTGPSDIAFSKLSGTPTAATTITLRDSGNNVKTLTINAKGTFSVQ
jgi:prepilin-type N-terminal cleavage/methylation domain-containing protein